MSIMLRLIMLMFYGMMEMDSCTIRYANLWKSSGMYGT